MKVSELLNHMNDHGTKPRINVFRVETDCCILIYEGSPNNADTAVTGLTVDRFTAEGKGFLKIYAH